MTDGAFHEQEIKERENDRWIAYQKEGLAPENIIIREKDWAKASLKSAMSNWHTCILSALAGGFMTSICAGILYMMRDSTIAWILCGIGIVAGIAALALFAGQALRKPVLHKSRSWILAEQQMGVEKK
jgi:hypothetical protein